MIMITAFLLVVGNVIPVLASTVSVDFSTDKIEYSPESTILVTGTVLKDGKAGTGTKPLLIIVNPSGETVQAYQWQDTNIGSEGQISTSIKLGKNVVNGTYTLQLTAGGAKKTKSITISGSTLTETIDFSIDKVEYNPNEVVHISGKVLLDNKPVNNRTISIKVEKDSVISEQNKVSNTLGEFQYDYQIPAGASAGTYKITASLADTNQKVVKEFIVKAVPVTPPPTPGIPGPTPPPPADLVAPEVDEVTSESTVINGKSEKGSTVTITDKKGLTVSGKTADNGTFSILLVKKIKEGTHIYATATDASGKVSKETIIVVTDKTPPTAPVVNTVTDYDKVLTGSAEPGSTVMAQIGTTIVGTKTVDKDGKFSMAIPVQRAGTTLLLTAKDLSGNMSSTTKVIVKDKTAPKAPILKEVSDLDKKVTGRAEKGSKVVIKAGSKMIAQGTSNANGDFTLPITTQKAGTQLIATATDKAGNVSAESKVVVKDKTAPKAPIVKEVSDSDQKVTGRAEKGSTVIIKVGKKVIAKGTSNTKGDYSIAIPKQKAKTVLEVTATDKAGNISKATKAQVKDKTAPGVPTVNAVKSSSTTVTGKSESGATVYVKAGKNVIGSATVNSKGNFTVKIKKQKTGTTLVIYAIDQAGNAGKSKSVKVK